MTQIVNNKIHKVDLCEACAQAKGVTNSGIFSLADVLLKTSVSFGSLGEFHCEGCGLTQQDFKKIGRFGCPVCYESFSSALEPMLDEIHKGTHHTGKIARRALERRFLCERLTNLETELEEAIKTERFEDAARYRDELSQVRTQAMKPFKEEK